MLEESIDVGGEKDDNRDHDTVIDDSAIDFFTDNESALTTPTGRSPPESILSPGPEDEEVTESGGNVANNNNNNGATGTSALDRRSVSERIKNITAASKNSRAVAAAATKLATKPDTTTMTKTEVPVPVATAKTTTTTKPVVARKMNIVRVATPSSKVEKLEQRSKRFGAPTSEEEKKKQRLGRFSASATTTTPAPSSSCNATAPATVVGPGTEKVSTATATTTKATKLVRGSAADRLAERQARFADTTLKKRQERFGVVTSRSLNLTTDMKTRKLMRAQKFGTVA